jgi:hypothetical protein
LSCKALEECQQHPIAWLTRWPLRIAWSLLWPAWAERGMWASLLWKEQELEDKVLLRAVKRSDGGKAKEGSNFLNSLYPKSCKNS